MPFTEFCCRSGGSNLNAGTRTGNSTEPGTSADFTYASGSWVASTGVFTVASGNPQSDGVAVGDFASVYADGSTVTGFVGRVTARTTTTITVSLSAKAGTAPTDGTSNRTLKIGGAWQGPNGSSSFPFGFIQSTLSNPSADPPCINFKNDATYSITAAMTHANTGRTTFSGYSSSYHDGGRATIDGGTSGASYVLLTLTGADLSLCDFIFQNNGATGSASGIANNTNHRYSYFRVVVNSVRGAGINSTQNAIFIECEVYSANQSNTSGLAGIVLGASSFLLRCVIHDNTGSNTDGVTTSGNNICFVFTDCVFDTNGRRGVNITGSNLHIFGNCEFYNNTGDGIRVANTGGMVAENCNFVKNGAYGIDGTGGTNNAYLLNCGFGAGTQANTSGQYHTNIEDGLIVIGTITYANDVTPWVDPANGDFRINLATAKGAGRGTFTQTAASYSGTVGYPDIGAAQHQDTGGSGGLNSVRHMTGGFSA